MNNIKKKAIRDIIWKGIELLVKVSSLLPMKFNIKLGGIIGGISFLVLRKPKKNSLNNIKLALDNVKTEKERKRIAKESFKNLGRSLFEVLHSCRINEKNIDDIITLKGEEYLKKERQNGKGIILIGGHVGNWELIVIALSLRGYKIKVVAAPIYDKRISDLIVRLRSHHNIETIIRGSRSAARQILSCLRNKEILAFLIDQDIPKVDGVFVNFFNKRCFTPSAPASIALKTNSKVMMAFTYREKEIYRHKVIIHKPIQLIKTGNLKEDIVSNTGIFSEFIEKYIRLFPEQWVWMHNRWKRSTIA
ncbi:MAG: lysophospholipid acyltransferase family protein [Nitrospirota bacterium]